MDTDKVSLTMIEIIVTMPYIEIKDADRVDFFTIS